MTEESFEIRISRTLGNIEAKQDALHEALLSPGGRIPRIEEDIAWADKKQWIHTAVVIPITAAIMALVRKLGMN